MGSCMLTVEMKASRVEICQQHYKNRDEDFLQHILTANEIWVPLCEPEIKQQPMKYNFKSFHVKEIK
jgi:hypothetical protein